MEVACHMSSDSPVHLGGFEARCTPVGSLRRRYRISRIVRGKSYAHSVRRHPRGGVGLRPDSVAATLLCTARPRWTDHDRHRPRGAPCATCAGRGDRQHAHRRPDDGHGHDGRVSVRPSFPRRLPPDGTETRLREAGGDRDTGRCAAAGPRRRDRGDRGGRRRRPGDERARDSPRPTLRWRDADPGRANANGRSGTLSAAQSR